jgi:hypothetical protein
MADEDYIPFDLQFTSSAFTGTRPAVEETFTTPVVAHPSSGSEGPGTSGPPLALYLA